MKPQRPYLLRAIYEWIQDSGEIPYLLVDANVPDVVVPIEHVEDGQIVLNIGGNAVRDLALGDEFVMFSSRFDGRAMELSLPIASIKAIYCKDSGEGMVFPEESLGAQPAVGKEPSAVGKEPSAVGKEPSAVGKEPSAVGKEPSAVGKEPSADSKEPSADSKKSSPSGDDKPTLRLV
ncbi:MAG: stringent starvation protein B [Candidatus Azotimanducaceae bacterium]